MARHRVEPLLSRLIGLPDGVGPERRTSGHAGFPDRVGYRGMSRCRPRVRPGRGTTRSDTAHGRWHLRRPGCRRCTCSANDPACWTEGLWAPRPSAATIAGVGVTENRYFADRPDAGRRLAGRMEHLRDEDVVVLGLPQGGVPVAFEVARTLAAPLDVIVVRKLGVPSQPELAMGAVGEGGVLVLNRDVVALAGIDRAAFAAVEKRERTELERRAQRFRGGRPRMSLAGRTALVVDDGIATGATARAACEVARAQGAARVVLAVPACSPRTAGQLRGEVDELIVLETPADFAA